MFRPAAMGKPTRETCGGGRDPVTLGCMSVSEDGSAGWQARCIACGYRLNVPREAGLCSECGEPLRSSVNPYLVKRKIADRARLSAIVALISLMLMPLLGPLAIFMGCRVLRDARTYSVSGLPRILAVAAIILGLLCCVSLLLWLDLLFMK